MINLQFNKSSITIWSIKYSPISKILLYLHVMIKNIAYDYIKYPIHTLSKDFENSVLAIFFLSKSLAT